MRLHLISLPHTQTTPEFEHCANTQKIRKFAKMMLAQGHEVILYSGDRNETACTEHVPLFAEAERLVQFGKWDRNGLFGNIPYIAGKEPWLTHNRRAIEAVRERTAGRDTTRDILCVMAGVAQKPVADALPKLLAVEPGVGYEGCALVHCAFESHAWQHWIYGKCGINRGRAFDTVIPNFFDPEDFPEWTGERGDYLFFIGRNIETKGPHVAADIAERCGKRLLIAGPGSVVKDGRIVSPPGLDKPHVAHLGPLTNQQRWQFMARAAAVVVPTLYLEPFGGVAIEAMMCGTPVAASDWGAFPETVLPGISGETFSTLSEGVVAVEKVAKLDRAAIRRYALDRFSLDAIGPRYSKWLARLQTLWGDGWYD